MVAQASVDVCGAENNKTNYVSLRYLTGIKFFFAQATESFKLSLLFRIQFELINIFLHVLFSFKMIREQRPATVICSCWLITKVGGLLLANSQLSTLFSSLMTL
jgi:hypothetical protein